MKIIIDTHIFLWALSYPERLDEKRRYAIESPANEVFFSAVSIAELMIKKTIGKITIDFDPLELALEMGLTILDFTGADALRLGKLPMHHKDPFDRMIISQAVDRKIAVMTDDSKFSKYQCKLM